jgi:hypothetical protein
MYVGGKTSWRIKMDTNWWIAGVVALVLFFGVGYTAYSTNGRISALESVKKEAKTNAVYYQPAKAAR